MTDWYKAAGLQGQPLNKHFVMDSHGHVGQMTNFLVLDTSLSGMVEQMDRVGIDMAAVSSIAGTIGGWQRGNDLTIRAVTEYPDRFFGYITVNAQQWKGILDECERCWQGGCRGLKLHTAQGIPYDDLRILPALEFAAQKRCPVLFHTWGEELKSLRRIIERFPDSPWILGHAGSVEPDAYCSFAKDFPNAFLETCFSRCPIGLIEHFVNADLIDRLLWGSDACFMASGQQIGRVLFADLPPEYKKQILCDNPQRVFGVGPNQPKQRKPEEND